MANRELKVHLSVRWWFRPGVAIFILLSRLGVPLNERIVSKFVNASVRVVI